MSSAAAAARRHRESERAAFFFFSCRQRNAHRISPSFVLTFRPPSFVYSSTQPFQIRDSQAQTLRALTVKQLHDVSWFGTRSETRAREILNETGSASVQKKMSSMLSIPFFSALALAFFFLLSLKLYHKTGDRRGPGRRRRPRNRWHARQQRAF